MWRPWCLVCSWWWRVSRRSLTRIVGCLSPVSKLSVTAGLQHGSSHSRWLDWVAGDRCLKKLVCVPGELQVPWKTLTFLMLAGQHTSFDPVPLRCEDLYIFATWNTFCSSVLGSGNMDEKVNAPEEWTETGKALEMVWGEHFLIQVRFEGFYLWSDFSVVFWFYKVESHLFVLFLWVVISGKMVWRIRWSVLGKMHVGTSMCGQQGFLRVNVKQLFWL